MRVFFDTNVLIATFISHGVCNELLDHCLAGHTICTSPQVLDELHRNLVKLGFTEMRAREAATLVRENSIILSPSPSPLRVCRDPDDDFILAAAVSGPADCLITGDQDLLILGAIHGIPILKPSDFWRFEKRKKRLQAR
jgi:putative PIN family toxin of toxin-antitoxin system